MNMNLNYPLLIAGFSSGLPGIYRRFRESVACAQTLFYFSFRSFRKHRRARERSESASFFFPLHYPLALMVYKSPVVYILSPALNGL